MEHPSRSAARTRAPGTSRTSPRADDAARPGRHHSGLVPGLVTVAGLTAAAYALARLPGVGLLGPLVLAMLLGALWRPLTPELRGAVAPGARFAAKHLLRIGIVLLGVRLDVRSLVELGPLVLAGSGVGIVVAFAAIEATGRAWGVPVALRRAVGIGTAVCGASAIAAALPVLRAKEVHASVSVAAISLAGTIGVVLFAASDALAALPAGLLAALAGATLQEVGQVVAAGSAMGPADADLALLVKLSRVVLLAPVLILLGWWGRMESSGGSRPAAAASAAIVPPFVIGFVLLGVVTSLGLLPAAATSAGALAGTVLTAAAMAGIGLSVDARAVGSAGRQALGLAAVGFVALVAAMSAYYAWALAAA